MVTDYGHVRRVTRTTKVLQFADENIGFPHARQLIQVRRTRNVYPAVRSGRKPKKSVEVVYLLCSLGHLDAPNPTLTGWVQSHWWIEYSLHWLKDVTFAKDSSRLCTGNGPRVMATLRSTGISLLRLAGYTGIAAALRFHGQDPGHAPLLISTARERL